MSAALVRSSLPLTWPELLDHARRRHLPVWRGEVYDPRAVAPTSAPIAVAACSWFRLPPVLATEAEAATYRVAAPYAANVVRAWYDARFDRDAVRDAINAIRDLERYGVRAEAQQRRADLKADKGLWWKYRRQMRRLHQRIATIQTTLAPYRPPVAAPIQIAAE